MSDAHEFSYPEVGATREGRTPDGYSRLHVRRAIGHGPETYRRAAEALMTYRMHRAIPVGITAERPRAAEGGAITVTLAGFVKAPCRFVWTVEDDRRTGWAYGTLEGHPESGEEAFVVALDDDGTVTLTVTAFSRPAHPLARLAAPVVPLMQRLYAIRCARVLARLSR
ncbi:DUF1990 domain-containing protein [Actinocorallia lasiicapitis]